jgi:hypothetical protein
MATQVSIYYFSYSAAGLGHLPSNNRMHISSGFRKTANAMARATIER